MTDIMTLKEFALYVKNELNNAYGGVKNWSEADAFEDIYNMIEVIVDD